MKVTNYWGCVVKKSCLCGCGKLIPAFNRDGDLQFYAVGHASRLYAGHKSRYKNGHEGMVGDKHPRWKPELTIDKEKGYVILKGKKKRYQHRDVYEKYYECCLLPYVDVHHENGIKHDNRIENLKPLYKTKHSELHYYQHMKIDTATGRFLNVHD
jgi:hypothetical protein